LKSRQEMRAKWLRRKEIKRKATPFGVKVEKLPAIVQGQIIMELKTHPQMAERVQVLVQQPDPTKAIIRDQHKAIAERLAPGTFPEASGAWPGLVAHVVRTIKARKIVAPAMAGLLAGLGAAKETAAATEAATKATEAAAGSGWMGAASSMFGSLLQYGVPAVMGAVKAQQVKKEEKKERRKEAAEQAVVTKAIATQKAEYQAAVSVAVPGLAPPAAPPAPAPSGMPSWLLPVGGLVVVGGLLLAPKLLKK